MWTDIVQKILFIRIWCVGDSDAIEGKENKNPIVFIGFSRVLNFVGVELEPVDSCAINNGGCAHSCRHGDGGPVCSCRKGYILQIDKKSCLGRCIHATMKDRDSILMVKRSFL